LHDSEDAADSDEFLTVHDGVGLALVWRDVGRAARWRSLTAHGTILIGQTPDAILVCHQQLTRPVGNAVGLVEPGCVALDPFRPPVPISIPQDENGARSLAYYGQIAVGEHERLTRVVEPFGKERHAEGVRHGRCPIVPLQDQG
jgi:hypothetical protein